MDKLFESDKINHSGYELHHGNKDAIPFAFNYFHRDCTNPFWGCESSTEDFWFGKNGSIHDFFDNINRKYTGRVWTKSKIMTFWVYPTKDIMNDCIKSIEKELNLQILNNGWQLEVRKKNFNGAKGVYKYYLIPIEEYVESIIDRQAYSKHLNKDHNNKVKGKYGSNISKPLALRQAMYAESLNTDKFLTSLNEWCDEIEIDNLRLNESKNNIIEDVLNTSTNFMLCKRCGNQLHHGLNICSKCGKNNGTNNGSIIRQILYTIKYRDLTKLTLSITPEIIYRSFQEKMPGVSEKEFLDYIDKNLYTTKTKKIVPKGLGSRKSNPLFWRQKMYSESLITKFDDF